MTIRLSAVNQRFVDKLRTEFDEWFSKAQHHSIFTDYRRGPIGDWRNIESFLADRYPESYKGFDTGQEEAGEELYDGHYQGGYQTGPDAMAEYGYDPKEVAAGMLLLHNQTHPLRQDLADDDIQRLNDISQKRHKMQQDYDKKQLVNASIRMAQNMIRYAEAQAFDLDALKADILRLHPRARVDVFDQYDWNDPAERERLIQEFALDQETEDVFRRHFPPSQENSLDIDEDERDTIDLIHDRLSVRDPFSAVNIWMQHQVPIYHINRAPELIDAYNGMDIHPVGDESWAASQVAAFNPDTFREEVLPELRRLSVEYYRNRPYEPDDSGNHIDDDYHDPRITPSNPYGDDEDDDEISSARRRRPDNNEDQGGTWDEVGLWHPAGEEHVNDSAPITPGPKLRSPWSPKIIHYNPHRPIPDEISYDDFNFYPDRYEINHDPHTGIYQINDSRDQMGSPPVGFLQYHQDGDDREPTIHVDLLNTHPSHRLQGVAAALMNALAEDFPNHKIDPGGTTSHGTAFVNYMRENAPGAKDRLKTDSWDASYPNQLDDDQMKDWGVKKKRSPVFAAIMLAQNMIQFSERMAYINPDGEEATSGQDLTYIAESLLSRAGHIGKKWNIPSANMNHARERGFLDHAGQPNPRLLQREPDFSGEAEKYVNDILAQHQYPGGWIRVEPEHWDTRMSGAAAATDGMNFIGLKGTKTDDMTLLHECAHIMTGTTEGDGHTPEFQNILRGLYRDHINPHAASLFGSVVGLPDE